MKAPPLEDKFEIHEHDEFEETYGDVLCVLLGVINSGAYGTQAQVLMQGTGTECKDEADELSEVAEHKFTHLLVMPMSDLAEFTKTVH